MGEQTQPGTEPLQVGLGHLLGSVQRNTTQGFGLRGSDYGTASPKLPRPDMCCWRDELTCRAVAVISLV